MTPAFFLDRDGVINVEVSYLGKAEDVELLPGVAEAVAAIHAAGFLAVVVTNQSGIARKMYSVDDMHAVHARIQRFLLTASPHAVLDGFYFCDHHPKYNRECCCRKPAPGMLLTAAKDLQLDLAASFMIGDRISDLAAGKAAGCRCSCLVTTGYGSEQIEAAQQDNFPIASSLFEAVTLLLASK